MTVSNLEEPQVYKKVFKLFQKWAKTNDASAQYSLAVIYENGYGVPQDYVKAYFYFWAAFENKDAQQRNDSISEKMTKKQIAEAVRLIKASFNRPME